MQRRSMSRILSLAIPLAIACVMLASGVSAQADSGDKNCSNRTLNGNYGGRSEGSLLPAPGVSLPFRALTMTHFDGRGNLTWVEHTVINGTLLGSDWSTTASGTYAVNPDCTGTATIDTPNSPVPLVLGLVIVRNGNEVDTVLDSNAIISVFVRVDQ
jgi:hypothetical protein